MYVYISLCVTWGLIASIPFISCRCQYSKMHYKQWQSWSFHSRRHPQLPSAKSLPILSLFPHSPYDSPLQLLTIYPLLWSTGFSAGLVTRRCCEAGDRDLSTYSPSLLVFLCSTQQHHLSISDLSLNKPWSLLPLHSTHLYRLSLPNPTALSLSLRFLTAPLALFCGLSFSVETPSSSEDAIPWKCSDAASSP